MSNVIRLNKDIIEPVQDSDSVVFTNSGEMDMRAVSIMGMSAKTSSDAIGYFGTGLKYAIAVFIRNGLEVRIFSGNKKYLFKKKQVDFRNRDFEVITMNGKELPFTTELGKNWELWQAYRELYCNCTDEKGVISLGNKPIKGLAGHTIISVTGKEVLTEHDRRGLTILDRAVIMSGTELDVCAGSNHSLFYKGIKVLQIKHSLYTYNFKCSMQLTEDRTLSYFWVARGKIMDFVLKSDDAGFIRDILTAQEGSYEADFVFTDSSEAKATPSETFITVAFELDSQQKRMNMSAYEIVKRQQRKRGGIRPVKSLSELKKKQLEEGIALAENLGFMVSDYQIITTDSFDSSVIGLAENGNIYISIRAYGMGVTTIARTLIEEFIHLRHGLADESRGMQNYIFDKLIEFGEELVNLRGAE